MLTTTTTMGLRAISAAPSCTTRSILRSPYGTLCPLGLRGSNGSNNPLVLSSPSSHTPNSKKPTSSTAAAMATPTAVPSSIRTESTLTNSTPGSQPGAPSPYQNPPPKDQPLDWQTFFTLRKKRRRYQLTFSVMSALGFSFGGALFLSSPGGEHLLTYFPLDPFIGFGLGMTGFMALGWLLGPAVGNTTFYMMHSRWKAQMTNKEIELFARIKKNRVDPTASSASNPVPDFYGEKIQSISGYRQWLKDQRAFNKKRTTFV
ncbi:hypothetical protein MKZ38_002407 [Zalerion maritima]|uniref:Presequence translocated-associated motor subunit PAM17 n=1 Tax=Zalerion maritima TaxID=339359 RepID=A0AAD5RQJ6_9PEZI|nr:hypothetical protein MKZ38_002407 [Zalerion maritima]